ncbi:hypothetical protein Purlil1_9740 [Purpureocillium lilacinum]|uniref:Uncharacterized protein n=1 Tax=Purpureocillium lilacinum TaxID=33203 RepID=A0ABR0BQ26_PURLI|nr:hypothetical protein Purlil1_9740 [Purpureocillium lilacinum]
MLRDTISPRLGGDPGDESARKLKNSRLGAEHRRVTSSLADLQALKVWAELVSSARAATETPIDRVTCRSPWVRPGSPGKGGRAGAAPEGPRRCYRYWYWHGFASLRGAGLEVLLEARLHRLPSQILTPGPDMSQLTPSPLRPAAQRTR